MQRLTEKDFATLFGIRVDELPIEVRKLIKKFDFSYRKVDNLKRKETILKVLKKISRNEFFKKEAMIPAIPYDHAALWQIVEKS